MKGSTLPTAYATIYGSRLVFVQDHLAVFHPERPGIAGDLLVNALAQFVVEWGLVQSRQLTLKLHAEHRYDSLARKAWRGWNSCPYLFPQVFLSALIIAHPTQATWLLLRAALSDSSRAQSQNRGRTPAGCSKITAPITMRGTMILPGETAAGSAGMQPYRGIAWWAHRDDHSSTRISFPRSCQGVFNAR